MMTIALVGLSIVFVTRRIVDRVRRRRAHEPRLVKLLGPAKPPCFDRSTVGAHECLYIKVQRLGEIGESWRYVSCGKPSKSTIISLPTPGPGVRMSR